MIIITVCVCVDTSEFIKSQFKTQFIKGFTTSVWKEGVTNFGGKNILPLCDYILFKAEIVAVDWLIIHFCLEARLG